MSTELIEYQCPSCGANLDFKDGQFITVCRYCGARVERQLDRSAQDKVHAQHQLIVVQKYRENMLTLQRLEKARKSATDRVRLCSQNVFAKPTLLERCPFIIAIAALLLASAVVLIVPGMRTSIILIGLIALSAIIVMAVLMSGANAKKSLAAEAKGRIDDAQKELVKAGDELEEFRRQFDINEIPKRYRSMELLDYMVHIFETAQACTMGEGFKMCDEYIAQKRIEDMHREQIARVAMLAGRLAEERAPEQFVKRGDDFTQVLIPSGASARTTGNLVMAIAKASSKTKIK